MEAKFLDQDFPPKPSSISIKGVNEWAPEKRDELTKLQWKRISDFNDYSSLSLFGDSPSFNDVEQGALSDCYFLAACSALAEYPDMVKKIFKTKNISKNGKYTLELYYENALREIQIDDYLPCKEEGLPAFAGIAQNKVWVPLLEKAYAKANKCYENIHTGWFSEAIQFLTGAPSITLYHDEMDSGALFEKISEADNLDQIMGCLILQVPTDKKFQTSGLVATHLYTLIGSNRVKTNKGEAKLVRLRNPWGYGEWNGDWSDSSNLWTEETKSQVEYSETEDGAFYMSIEDYKKYFSNTYISAAVKDYHNSSIPIQLSSKPFAYSSFILPKDTKGYLSVNQTSYRKLAIVDKELMIGYLGLMLFKLTNDKDNPYEYIDGFKGIDDMISLQFPEEIPEGNYFAIGHAHFTNSKPVETNFSTYTNNLIKLNSYQPSEAGFVEKVLIEAAKKVGEESSVEDHEEIKIYNAINSTKSNIGVYAIINESETNPVKFTITPTFSGMGFISEKENSTAELVVFPQSQGCFLFELFEENCSCEVEYSYEILSENYKPKSTSGPPIHSKNNIQNKPAKNLAQKEDLPNLETKAKNIEEDKSNFEDYSDDLNELPLNQDEEEDKDENDYELIEEIIKEGANYKTLSKDSNSFLIIYTFVKKSILYFGIVNSSEKKLTLKFGFNKISGLLPLNANKDCSWNINLENQEKCCKKLKIQKGDYSFDPYFYYKFN